MRAKLKKVVVHVHRFAPVVDFQLASWSEFVKAYGDGPGLVLTIDGPKGTTGGIVE